jgi:hypothetical protein
VSVVQRVLQSLFLGAINHQVTYILVSASLFAEARQWVAERNAKLGELVRCHLCMGTWVGFWMALVFRPCFVQVRPVRGVYGAKGHLFRTTVQLLADAFLIAFIGRVINEVVAVVQREVRVREEQAELLDTYQQNVRGEVRS